MWNVPSLHPKPSRTGVSPGQLQSPRTYPHGSPQQFLDLRKVFNRLHNEYDKI